MNSYLNVAVFRYKDIKGEALEAYFDFVHKKIGKLDMVEANLTLAEDRILSLEACIHNSSGKAVTKWAPHATFYFEAELSLDNFSRIAMFFCALCFITLARCFGETTIMRLAGASADSRLWCMEWFSARGTVWYSFTFSSFIRLYSLAAASFVA